MLQKTLQLYKNAYSGLSREVWLLAIISLINRAGTMVFPFMTIYLTVSLKFTLKEAGIIMSFFGLGSIIGSYCGGWLTDRVGNYKVQFWSLILTSITLLFIMRVQSFWGISAMAFLLSLVADAFRPANKVAVSNYSTPENLTRSFALLRLAVNLGFAIGPALGGILAAWKGYDLLFYADALTCLLAAIFFKFTLKDDFKATEIKKASNESVSKQAEVTSPYQDVPFMFFLLIVSILSFVFLQLFYTMPVFFKQDLGLNEGYIGAFMALNGLLIGLFEMPLVYIAERQLPKFTSMMIGGFLIGIGYLAFSFSALWIGVAAIAMIFLTLGEILYMPFASAFVASRSEDANRGQYMALYSMSWATASVVAPSSGFLLVEYFGFNGLWVLMFLLASIGSLGFWFLGKTLNRRKLLSLD